MTTEEYITQLFTPIVTVSPTHTVEGQVLPCLIYAKESERRGTHSTNLVVDRFNCTILSRDLVELETITQAIQSLLPIYNLTVDDLRVVAVEVLSEGQDEDVEDTIFNHVINLSVMSYGNS